MFYFTKVSRVLKETSDRKFPQSKEPNSNSHFQVNLD